MIDLKHYTEVLKKKVDLKHYTEVLKKKENRAYVIGAGLAAVVGFDLALGSPGLAYVVENIRNLIDSNSDGPFLGKAFSDKGLARILEAGAVVFDAYVMRNKFVDDRNNKIIQSKLLKYN